MRRHLPRQSQTPSQSGDFLHGEVVHHYDVISPQRQAENFANIGFKRRCVRRSGQKHQGRCGIRRDGKDHLCVLPTSTRGCLARPLASRQLCCEVGPFWFCPAFIHEDQCPGPLGALLALPLLTVGDAVLDHDEILALL